MTLIAAIRLAGLPVMFADILVTAKVLPSAHEPLPTFQAHELEVVHPAEWYRKFRPGRKVLRINPRLIVAWTGDVLAARPVLRLLQETFCNKEPSLTEIETCLSSIEDQHPFNCLLLGWLAHGPDAQAFQWSSEKKEKLELVEDFALGSGEPELVKLSKECVIHDLDITSGTPYERAQRQAVAIAGNLLGTELADATTLHQRFGAGYEIFVFDGCRFEPVQSATYIVWGMAMDPGVVSTLPTVQRVIRYFYVGDFMFAQTGRVSSKPGDLTPNSEGMAQLGTLQIDNIDLFGIWHVIPEAPPPQAAWRQSHSFESDFLINVIVVDCPDGNGGHVSFATRGNGPNRFVRLELQAGKSPGLRIHRDTLMFFGYNALKIGLAVTGLDRLLASGTADESMANIHQSRPRLAEHLESVVRYLDRYLAEYDDEIIASDAARFRAAAVRLTKAHVFSYLRRCEGGTE
jgi:hypothetical protein